MWRHLRAALRTCGIPRMTWYEATKHTLASHWLMNGNPIEKLASILGHSDAEVTGRYGHLRADLFTEKDLAALPGDPGQMGYSGYQGANGLRLGYQRTNSEIGKSGNTFRF